MFYVYTAMFVNEIIGLDTGVWVVAVLIHGDSHLRNLFVTGDRMGMLDWQAAQWAKGRPQSSRWTWIG